MYEFGYITPDLVVVRATVTSEVVAEEAVVEEE